MPVDDHGHEEAHLPKDRAEPLVLPDKKQWQVTRSLSSYQYALPPFTGSSRYYITSTRSLS